MIVVGAASLKAYCVSNIYVFASICQAEVTAVYLLNLLSYNQIFPGVAPHGCTSTVLIQQLRPAVCMYSEFECIHNQ